MAEPLIYEHSPLADYLINQVPNEMPFQSETTITPTSTPISILSNHSNKFLLNIKSFLASPSSYLPLEHNYQPLSQPTNSHSPTLAHQHIPDPDKRLSERLKYLICSSCLLNPNLEPAFYDSHVSSNQHSFPSHQLGSPTNPDPLHPPSSLPYSTLPLLTWLPSLPRFRLHARLTIALFALLLLIGYHASLSWALFCLPFLAIASSNRLPSRLFRNHLLNQHSPRASRLSLHSDLVSAAAELVDKSQALDLHISRGFGAVKEVECVALGLGLSNPMPPISRLETASFPLAGSSSPSPSSPLSNCASPLPARPQFKLHAIGLRKVLQRVLDQARHEYERVALELESVIDSPLLNPAIAQPGSGPSPLATLMDMYACSRQSTPDTPVARRRSVNDRVRRQTWRASLNARPAESPSGLPLSPQDSRFNRDQFSTPRSAKRATWQPVSSPTRCLSDSHNRIMDDRKLVHLRTHSRPSSVYGTPSNHEPGHATPRRLTPSLSPVLVSDFAPQRETPRPRPASYYPGTRPPLQSAAASPGGQRASMLGLSSAGRSKPRPASMMASSFRCASSPSPYCQPGRSPELSPNGPPSPCNVQHCDGALDDEPEPPPPLSLRALQYTFERMTVSRKRLLCCLLALDFSLATPAGLGILQETGASVRDMIKTVEGLGAELMAGMSAEFGPGSFEGGAVVRGRASEQQEEAGRGGEQEEEEEEEQVRNFAPPVPPAEAKAQRMGQLMGQLEAMDLALRSISAKMQVCVEELGAELEGGGAGTARAVAVHDSIRQDLETVAREWDASRSKLRSVVEGERAPRVGTHRLRPTSLDSSEGGASVGGWSGVGSSVVSSEVLTPVEEYGAMNGLGEEESEESEPEPVVAQRAMVAPPGLEEMLEGVVGKRGGGARGSKWSSKMRQLTREERLELMEQRRQSLPVLVGRRQSGTGVAGQMSGGEQQQQAGGSVVNELKEVLNVLKSKRVEQVKHQT